MDLRQALDQIGEIRQRMAGSQTFRGYRSATVALSGLAALVAAALQPRIVSDPAARPLAFVLLWSALAALAVATAAAELLVRNIRRGSPLQRDLTVRAVGQFIPSLIAGLLLTVVVLRFAPSAAWMLPGLWCVLFALGIFASRHVLSPAVVIPGGYYLLAGLAILAFAQGQRAFWPWSMGLAFGPGQLISAAVLYWTVERNHAPEDDAE